MRWEPKNIAELQASPGVKHWVLKIASYAFGVLVWLRNKAFDAGLLPRRRASVRVISIGNLTTGGTGKTAVVRLIAEALAPLRVGILTRGYGHSLSREPHRVSPSDSARRVGDEPALLARWLPDAAVVVSGSRAAAAISLTGEVDVLLLDDGFQHRWLQRDVDVVVVSPTPPPPLLPQGMSREPVSALARADIIWVHEDGLEPGDRSWLERWRHKPMIESRYTPVALRRLDVYVAMTRGPKPQEHGERRGQDILHVLRAGMKVHVLTAIARGERVSAMIRSLGGDVCGATHLPDHAALTGDILNLVEQRRRDDGADFVVLTEKEAVKVQVSDVVVLASNFLVLEVLVEVLGGMSMAASVILSAGRGE